METTKTDTKPTLKPIRCQLTNERGDTVLREDGTPLMFILVDEAALRARCKYLTSIDANGMDWYLIVRALLGEAAAP
jgi:hypothetical protein